MDNLCENLSYLRKSVKSIKRFFSESPLRNEHFRVRGFAIREVMPRGFINRPHGTDDYLMMYFHTPAQGGVSVDDVMPADTFYMWAPGEAQFYGHAEKGFTHSWLHCEGDSVSLYYKLIYKHGPVQLKMRSPQSFLLFLDSLREEILNNRDADEIVAGNLLTNWMRDLMRHTGKPPQALPERLRVVRDFINEHYTEPITLPQLAHLANWSVPHFSEEFRRHIGESPIDYVIRQRLLHASYLLQDVNLSVTDIANRVGYDNLYHFSKSFKRRFHLSPRNFRERNLTPEKLRGPSDGKGS